MASLYVGEVGRSSELLQRNGTEPEFKFRVKLKTQEVQDLTEHVSNLKFGVIRTLQHEADADTGGPLTLTMTTPRFNTWHSPTELKKPVG